MPRYLLDTDICIYIVKQKPPQVIKRFTELNVGDVVMSLITHGELRAGAEKSQQPTKAHASFDALTAIIPPQLLPETAATVYGEIRSALEAKGQVIGPNDLWIAAHAVAENLVLVSNNQREFSRVPGLKLENWI